VDFAFSEEQEALRASARDYLADRFPLERVVQLADSDAGWDPTTWQELAGMGWLDPDLGVLEHSVLAEETGFGLLPAPLFATVGLAWPLLDEELRAAVATGERSVTLASAGDVQAGSDNLTGVRKLVPDLTSVTDVVVPTSDGVFVVDVAAHPDVVVSRSTMDRTRRLGELHLDGTPARRLDVSLDALTDVRRRSLA
jgi:hypothetical protein